jgi:hypothetical protein
MACTQIERLPTSHTKEQLRVNVLEQILSTRVRAQEVTNIVIKQGVPIIIITFNFYSDHVIRELEENGKFLGSKVLTD